MRSNEEIEDAMNRYGDIVLRSCSAVLSSRHDAEDAFQDTFVRYATKDVAFNDEEHRKAWLIRVAVNISRDRLRKAAARDIPLMEQDDIPSASAFGEQEQTTERLHMDAALRELSPDQRTAILLSIVEGYTVPEIAEMMDRPANTVYSFITRGKKKLRKALGHDERA